MGALRHTQLSHLLGGDAKAPPVVAQHGVKAGRAADLGGPALLLHLGLRPPSKDFDYNQPQGPNDYILLRNGQKKLVRSLQGGEHR